MASSSSGAGAVRASASSAVSRSVLVAQTLQLVGHLIEHGPHLVAVEATTNGAELDRAERARRRQIDARTRRDRDHREQRTVLALAMGGNGSASAAV